MSRRRAISLLVVHLLILAHIAHWLATGRTVSPVEPSEAMYTLNDGQVNAGFVFFALALASTLIMGRFVCGWGCHVIAYQDICSWLLKKVGIKPKPFRSRILVLAPLSLALYMFVWPSAYRWWMEIPSPALSNHLMATDFWKTFPGPVIAVITILVCGFVIVYFLGSKGFCTYACPYGGFFRVADKIAPVQILVSDACEQCGHCTATCTSNVRVHEEVARYGAVVDPGCMKCLDCVSVCPNGALRVGFGAPSILARRQLPRSTKRYDFALWEEAVMVVVGVGVLLALRGLYNQVPLLLAMGVAAITAYLFVVLARLARVANVRLQNLQLRRGGRWTRSGVFIGATAVVLLVFAAHSAVVQYHVWQGQRLFQSLVLPDAVWAAGDTWWLDATDEQRDAVDGAVRHLERADSLGLMATPVALRDQVWLYLASGKDGRAERVVRRLVEGSPQQPDSYRGLGDVLRKTGREDEAEEAYRHALALDPGFALARRSLCSLLLAQGRVDETVELYRFAISHSPTETSWRVELSRVLLGVGRYEEAHTVLAELNELDPNVAEAQYNLGMLLLKKNETEEAIAHLTYATQARPDFQAAYYNLAVSMYMVGRPGEALPHIREAIRLQPNDAAARAFLEVVLQAIEEGEDSLEPKDPDE